jgi:hypothetical protein
VRETNRLADMGLRTAAIGLLLLSAGAGARAQQLHLFADPESGLFQEGRPESVAVVPLAGSPEAPPFGNLSAAALARGVATGPEATGPLDWSLTPSPDRRCVLLQCEALPIRPAPKLFSTGTTLWTTAGLLVGIIDGMQGPINDGVHAFHFTDEGFFQYWTYGGGSDKASHAIISANVAGLLYDAYRINGLTEDQSFTLALGTTIVAGTLVEIGDGLTRYGFSAQDLTADTVGALASALVRRNHLDDLIGFQFGKVPTTIPPEIVGGRPLVGIDYSREIYGVQLKLGGLATRLHARPTFARFFQSSFVFLTKGFGYEPPIPSRYQQVGLELGLNFQEILRAVGVDESTWWGDSLLRIFGFLRIPYTQVGAYYNFRNKKWYGPGAPYHYY